MHEFWMNELSRPSDVLPDPVAVAIATLLVLHFRHQLAVSVLSLWADNHKYRMA
jgi:hypothetical protein